MIYYNQVYQSINKEAKNRLRVIEIDNPIAYYVELHGDTSMPKKLDLAVLEAEIQADILLAIPDPYAKSYSESDLTDNQRQKRDEDWRVVSEAWNVYKEGLLTKKTREGIFAEIASKSGMSKLKIKRAFTRFWQRGLNKNALLPDYMYSGGKGKERDLSESKVGRPRKYALSDGGQQGINITEEVKKQFAFVIKKYYRKKERISLADTYDYLLREFYSDQYYENNIVKYKVWNVSRIPTYNQFYYWFKKYEDPQLDITLRISEKEFNLKHRPILSNSTLETDGPGTRFQIDATIGDIYLVSSFDRSLIIGRPVIYGIIDVYSRMVTGIYVGLEGPSWIGAMMALDNMMTDKVEYCQQFNINIEESQWPAKYLPEIIIADRGEFEGYSPENLINNLNIKIENTSAYRGDLKGIIERQFRTINGKIKRKTPGAIQKEYRERGDRDYRLDASLNLEEFTKVVIHLVLKHNQKIIEKYPLEKGMITSGLTATPINTKRYYGDDHSIRSTADSGGQQLARGLEHQMLHEIKAQGELQDFINVLKVLEQYPEVKAIRAFMDVLPEGLRERKFTKLSDGVTKRRYVIGDVYMMDGKRYNIIEVEREKRSLSTLILYSPSIQDWDTIIKTLLINLVNASGTWNNKSLKTFETKGVKIVKCKHSRKGIRHRSGMLLNKLL